MGQQRNSSLESIFNEVALVAGTAQYAVNQSVNDVLEAYISTTAAASNTASTNDISLTKIDRSAYAALPNKLQTGQPSQYFVDRQTTPQIFLYLAPDATTYTTLKFYSIDRIQDAGIYTNQADVVYRFLPCMCSGLAYYLSVKRAPDRIQLLKQLYEDELLRALNEDGQRASVYIFSNLFWRWSIMSYATGKRSKAISDRSGMAFPYKEMVKEWNGSLVHISEFEAKHPQLDPPYHKADAVALKNTRSMKFQQPSQKFSNDTTISDSGGIVVGVANLSLPGDFAFKTQEFNVTTNGITTTIHSMIPEDPSLQNRRRELLFTMGSVRIGIS